VSHPLDYEWNGRDMYIRNVMVLSGSANAGTASKYLGQGNHARVWKRWVEVAIRHKPIQPIRATKFLFAFQ